MEYIDRKRTAKIIKKNLSKKFPETKFYVQSENKNSVPVIRISYVDGPSKQSIREMMYGYKDNYGHPNYYPNNEKLDGEIVTWGVDYIFVNRVNSEIVMTSLIKDVFNECGFIIPDRFISYYRTYVTSTVKMDTIYFDKYKLDQLDPTGNLKRTMIKALHKEHVTSYLFT